MFFVAMSTAAAQNICAKREEIVEKLWNRWQEKLVAHGLANDNRLVELFVAGNGSWTVVVSDPNGRSCVASAGLDWTSKIPEAPGKGT